MFIVTTLSDIFLIFLTFIYSTSLREQDKAYINSSRWSKLVGLKPAYICMWVARSTTALQMVTLQTGMPVGMSLSHFMGAFYYCWSDCLSCPTKAIQVDQTTWVAVRKHSHYHVFAAYLTMLWNIIGKCNGVVPLVMKLGWNCEEVGMASYWIGRPWHQH